METIRFILSISTTIEKAILMMNKPIKKLNDEKQISELFIFSKYYYYNLKDLLFTLLYYNNKF